MKTTIMKLHELPRDHDGIKIYGDYTLHNEDGKEVAGTILFHHIDGMYSYCTLVNPENDAILNKDGSRATAHLYANATIEPYQDGYRLTEVNS